MADKNKYLWIGIAVIAVIILAILLIINLNSKTPLPENPPFEIREIKWEKQGFTGVECSAEEEYCALKIKLYIPEKNEVVKGIVVGYDKYESEITSENLAIGDKWFSYYGFFDNVGEKEIEIQKMVGDSEFYLRPDYEKKNLILCWTTDEFRYVWGNENKAKNEYRCYTKIIDGALKR